MAPRLFSLRLPSPTFPEKAQRKQDRAPVFAVRAIFTHFNVILVDEMGKVLVYSASFRAWAPSVMKVARW